MLDEQRQYNSDHRSRRGDSLASPFRRNIHNIHRPFPSFWSAVFLKFLAIAHSQIWVCNFVSMCSLMTRFYCLESDVKCVAACFQYAVPSVLALSIFFQTNRTISQLIIQWQMERRLLIWLRSWRERSKCDDDDVDEEEGGIENKNSLVNFSFFHSLFLYYFSPLFRVYLFHLWVSPILSQLITRA